MSDTLDLLEALLACPSITPNDQGCQALLTQRLQPLGFACETLSYGPSDFRVTNLWALREVASAPLLLFAGHTDVVPTGPLERWGSDPFVPTHRDGKLYARGASDMKTSLAAMVVATEAFCRAHPQAPLSIGFLLTSDEEGPALHGTREVVNTLRERGIKPQYCVVGEPTAVEQTGDMIKNGRRGSLSGRLTVHGKQGHVAYPQLARNPIHLAAPALAALCATTWDEGNAHFPPTTFQISNIHAGTGAGNVIPGECVIDFNFRFSTENTQASLRQRTEAILQQHEVAHTLQWTLGGEPFLTPVGTLVQNVQAAIADVTGLRTALSTTGGTSDGRFIATLCPEVIELGPPNATIHQVDECVNLHDVEPLTRIYQRVLERLAGVAGA
jgi:succinyl-diaminopimelate desuccinylase